MNPKAYILGFWSTPALAIMTLLGVLTPPVFIAKHAMDLAGIGPVLTYVVFVRKAWISLDKAKKRPNPNEAFWLCVPVLNMILQYRTLYPLGKVIQADAEAKAHTNVQVGDAFSRVLCNLSWIGVFFIPVCFLASFSSRPISAPWLVVIITLGLFWLAWLVVANIVLWHYSSVINLISNASTTKQLE